MCGRFTLTSSQEQISSVLPGLVLADTPPPRYNIAPSQDVLAVLNDGERRLTPVRWGLIPAWAKDASIGNRMINARAETLHEKTSFKRSFRARRCLILASGFYEWQANPRQRVKTPHYIRLKSGRPFAFAGLWDQWQSGEGTIRSATIITTQPNELMQTLHDRMPVILAGDDLETWLNPDEVEYERLQPLLAPFPAGLMEAYPVSRDVNKPAVDAPSCIARVEEPADNDPQLF